MIHCAIALDEPFAKNAAVQAANFMFSNGTLSLFGKQQLQLGNAFALGRTDSSHEQAHRVIGSDSKMSGTDTLQCHMQAADVFGKYAPLKISKALHFVVRSFQSSASPRSAVA